MSESGYRFSADAVVIFHFAFVAFVMAGGLLVLRWRRVAFVHLPCVLWGIYIELSHGICPLTPLENRLRRLGGGDVYGGGFVDHYIMPVLYPKGLTNNVQVMLAVLIITINVACYTGAFLLARRARRRRALADAAFPVVEQPIAEAATESPTSDYSPDEPAGAAQVPASR